MNRREPAPRDRAPEHWLDARLRAGRASVEAALAPYAPEDRLALLAGRVRAAHPVDQARLRRRAFARALLVSLMPFGVFSALLPARFWLERQTGVRPEIWSRVIFVCLTLSGSLVHVVPLVFGRRSAVHRFLEARGWSATEADVAHLSPYIAELARASTLPRAVPPLLVLRAAGIVSAEAAIVDEALGRLLARVTADDAEAFTPDDRARLIDLALEAPRFSRYLSTPIEQAFRLMPPDRTHERLVTAARLAVEALSGSADTDALDAWRAVDTDAATLGVGQRRP